MRIALLPLDRRPLAAGPAVAAAQQPGVPVPEAAAAAPIYPSADPRVNQLIIYGDDPCPQSTNEEIIVCARLPENDRYRIPPNVRDDPNDPSSAELGQSRARTELPRPYRNRELLADRRRRLHRLLQSDRPAGRAERAGRYEVEPDDPGGARGAHAADRRSEVEEAAEENQPQ